MTLFNAFDRQHNLPEGVIDHATPPPLEDYTYNNYDHEAYAPYMYNIPQYPPFNYHADINYQQMYPEPKKVKKQTKRNYQQIQQKYTHLPPVYPIEEHYNPSYNNYDYIPSQYTGAHLGPFILQNSQNGYKLPYLPSNNHYHSQYFQHSSYPPHYNNKGDYEQQRYYQQMRDNITRSQSLSIAREHDSLSVRSQREARPGIIYSYLNLEHPKTRRRKWYSR
ncbi:unnamed protein product [Didymodactylos carnosus]|uniref:Uncharacterized protein n=1 Tax=Didymodactylos carnosus TaxID=1234261 RepID=A0A8S2GWT2_9BILA|nr:unnamed protein product [Didymodactylos carnosus]CAF3572867.1 unnamed protein product [Didymodactylos carnosus]